MKTLNQIRLLHLNAPDILLNKHIEKTEFFYLFLLHSQELFLENSLEFKVMEPLLEGDGDKSQSTKIGVNNEELFEVFIMIDNFNNDITLFITDKENKYCFICENKNYECISVEEYMNYLYQTFEVYRKKKEHS